MFPTVAGADVVAYNLAALKDKAPLILDGTTVANIFLGKITKWNDPAIAATNPGVALPARTSSSSIARTGRGRRTSSPTT